VEGLLSVLEMRTETLKGKVVLVTGGAGLLGSQFSRGIVQNGGIVWITDLNQPKARALRDELIADSGSESVYAAELDITSKASILRCIEQIHSKHGRIDAVVNAAYPRTAGLGKHFFDLEYQDFCENVNIQLGGAFLVAQQLAGYFIGQGHGNIVFIASIQGVIAPRFDTYEGTTMTSTPTYSALKAGMIHLARYMAKYLKGKNIRVNVVSPGGILDGQPESFLKRYQAYASTKGMLDRDDVTGTVIYLLSEASAFVNGQNIVVDDGFSL
jgi:NAD(P)-dependent dehydrogenase (short-subunit alcohol dehydrogenase family)